MNWWILEDALNSKQGHYFEYIRTFKEGLEAEGDSVRIFVDRTAEDWLVDALGVERELPRSIWARMSDGAPRWKKLLRYPAHGWATYRAVARLLRSNQGTRPDVVFFPSVFTHHLVGLVPFLRRFAPQMQTKFLLFFPSTPIRRDPKTGKAIPKSDLTAQWFAALIGALRSLVESGQVVLGAETRAMQDALTGLCGLPFIYLPHPVSFPRPGEFATRTDHLIIGHYGTSRFEKGSDLFQSAAKIWLKRNPEANVRFVVQWTKDFDNETGRRIKKDNELQTHPKFEFIDRYFEPDGGYLRQVAATGVMVLPYRDSYRYRLSRVVIEAMLAGLPVVVTQGTTLHEQAAEHGAAVGIEMDSVESLVEGINEAVANFGTLRTQALEKALSSADHFSVANFRKALRICVNLI